MVKAEWVSVGEAEAIVRRREAELRFSFPPEKTRRLFELFFAKGKSRADRHKLVDAIELLVEMEVPDSVRDQIPVELLNLPDVDVLRVMIADFAVAEAEGIISPEVAKAVLSRCKRESQRVREAERLRSGRSLYSVQHF